MRIVAFITEPRVIDRILDQFRRTAAARRRSRAPPHQNPATGRTIPITTAPSKDPTIGGTKPLTLTPVPSPTSGSLTLTPVPSPTSGRGELKNG